MPAPALEVKKLGDAGWSSPVARQAHNLKVAGSNPAPATKQKKPRFGGAYLLSATNGTTKRPPAVRRWNGLIASIGRKKSRVALTRPLAPRHSTRGQKQKGRCNRETGTMDCGGRTVVRGGSRDRLLSAPSVRCGVCCEVRMSGGCGARRGQRDRQMADGRPQGRDPGELHGVRLALAGRRLEDRRRVPSAKG